MKKDLKHLISQPIFKNVTNTKYPTQMGKLSLPQIPVAGIKSALTSISTQEKKEKLKKRIPPWQKKKKEKQKPQ